jgi:hypothetical protein
MNSGVENVLAGMFYVKIYNWRRQGNDLYCVRNVQYFNLHHTYFFVKYIIVLYIYTVI